ncbi:hypothetical protein TWF718_007471 [Orbilia javanica]|uniref:Uncharacterized protein n=1 Tax=Orbilia javanica TaxID=47235 RepID=A0AAN8MRI7_9PEZI
MTRIESIPPIQPRPLRGGQLYGREPPRTMQTDQRLQEMLLMEERIKWPGLYENPMPYGWAPVRREVEGD